MVLRNVVVVGGGGGGAIVVVNLLTDCLGLSV